MRGHGERLIDHLTNASRSLRVLFVGVLVIV
jgi:hypothetical protein